MKANGTRARERGNGIKTKEKKARETRVKEMKVKETRNNEETRVISVKDRENAKGINKVENK